MPAIYKNGLLYAGTSGGSGANTDIIADEYTEKAYAVGDYCIHEDALYKCNTAITVAESWTAAHWTEKDIATELKAINSTISTLGTAATKNVPVTGNASSTEVVMGNDSRLTNSRPASDTTSTYSSTGTVPVNGIAVASAISSKMNTSNPSGTGSFSMNRKANTTVGNYSTAEGYNCTASGSYSHAEGESTTATGRYGSHAEGLGAEASGDSSHAEGGSTTASGECSHAEGGATTAGARYSHAEGNSTTANAEDAHAEGLGCTASGLVSHAEGGYTTSSGSYSHVEGYYTTAQRKSQHVFGEYNVLDTTGDTTTKGDYVEIVGNGTSTSARSNARTLDWSGNEWIAGNYKSDALTASKLLVSDANKNIISSSLAESDLITTSNIGSQSVNYATSAADSSKLDGASAATTATANTIVKRDGNGYIYATYYNQSSKAETPTTSSYAVYCNSDGWFRKSSLANMRKVLDAQQKITGAQISGRSYSNNALKTTNTRAIFVTFKWNSYLTTMLMPYEGSYHIIFDMNGGMHTATCTWNGTNGSLTMGAASDVYLYGYSIIK